MALEDATHHLKQVEFSVYTPDELVKMSSAHITQLEAFDPLGQPIEGGLYDDRLGPAKRLELCKTCKKGQMWCEGHVGHIQLPLPVYNPVFIRNVIQILKVTCFNCRRFLFDKNGLYIFLTQLEAIDNGVDYLVDEIAEQAQMLIVQLEGHENYAETFREKLRSILAGHTKCKSVENPIKSFVNRKAQMLKAFLTGRSIAASKTCHYCGTPRYSINLVNNLLIMCSKMKARKSNIASKPEDDDPEEEGEEASGTLSSTVHQKGQWPLDADECRKMLRELWSNEKDNMRILYPLLHKIESTSSYEFPTDAFFWEMLNVASTKFKPLRQLGDRNFEDEQRAHLKQILTACFTLQESISAIKKDNVEEEVVVAETEENNNEKGKRPKTKKTKKVETDKKKDSETKVKEATNIHYAWQRLQTLCNRLYDTDMDKLNPNSNASGVRQVIEKKEGLFRKHMMGKRVNFSARSVISPDPYISANEVGIPVIFALRLTYPETVFHHNLKKMQAAILNGPDTHPGAVSVTFEDGFEIRLKPHDPQQRIFLSERLVSSVYRSECRPIVNRHLVSGDILLFNRQPTLHKPSIMAHVARVLPNEKTLRLHYSNCKSYNADFDGDEMNAHFPQNEIARAEAYEIASVNHQYLVPKDGTPLSGLIQDHIVSATLFSTRGVFFDEDDYNELLYSALSFLNRKIVTVPPTILKPKKLWSGKQLVTSIILNVIPKGKPLPTAYYAAKVKEKSLTTSKKKKSYHSQVASGDMCESQVIIRKGHHLCGVIDKSSIGNSQYGLVHVCYELYGGAVSTNMITAFARLATNYLQCHVALTLGIEDILVVNSADKKRKKFVEKSATLGPKAVTAALATGEETEDVEKLKEKVQMAHLSKDPFPIKLLDGGFKQLMDGINNDISSTCLDGLIKKFPSNNLQLMIQTGAKGGTVNALQISCLLGQIELEGKRPPMMMSGKTLPSFAQYDMSPRAGGFITGRFLTGIKPQEFFFHCMAGREGLIDTAVKTSRSGYLQRCIIKHLEGLVVNYDLTVRDSDGSVVQFMYGEDGLDVTKSQLLTPKTLSLIRQNAPVIRPKPEVEALIAHDLAKKSIIKRRKRISKWQEYNGTDRTKLVRGSGFLDFALNQMKEPSQPSSSAQPLEDAHAETSRKGDIISSWFDMAPSERKAINERYSHCPDPINHLFSSATYHGVISEKMEDIMNNYIDEDIIGALPLGEKESAVEDEISDFKNCFYSRYIKSLADAGEAVGLLAAQSIGEPSTQMTLNTFHFAGRGEMNVTLGIPRLREIIMTASKNISTPSMDIPFRPDVTEQEAAATRLLLNSVKLSDVLEHVDVQETLVMLESTGLRSCPIKRSCRITFNFLKYKYFKGRFNVTPEQILKYLETKYIAFLCDVILKKTAALRKTNSLYDHSVRVRENMAKTAEESEEGDGESGDGEEDSETRNRKDREAMNNARKAIAEADDESSEDEDTGDPDNQDTLSKKKAARHNQDAEYEEPEEEENVPNEELLEEENDSAGADEKEKNVSADADGKESSPVSRASSPESKSKEDRIKNVINLNESMIKDYDFDDSVKSLQASVTLQLDLSAKLDFGSIVDETARKSYVYRVGQINRAFLVKDSEAAKKNLDMDQMIKTEGVSFLTMVRFSDVLDLNRMYSNDLHAIAETYGIEAAAMAIRREIKNVFAVYGIAVDPRHLSLVSDYMTLSGRVCGMNRDTMSSQASIIQQMTFETTTNFLKSATFAGFTDTLESPSARIFAGIPSKGGTGFFSLLQQQTPCIVSEAKARKSFGATFGGSVWRPSNTTNPKKGKRKSKIVLPTLDYKRSKY